MRTWCGKNQLSTSTPQKNLINLFGTGNAGAVGRFSLLHPGNVVGLVLSLFQKKKDTSDRVRRSYSFSFEAGENVSVSISLRTEKNSSEFIKFNYKFVRFRLR